MELTKELSNRENSSEKKQDKDKNEDSLGFKKNQQPRNKRFALQNDRNNNKKQKTNAAQNKRTNERKTKINSIEEFVESQKDLIYSLSAGFFARREYHKAKQLPRLEQLTPNLKRDKKENLIEAINLNLQQDKVREAKNLIDKIESTYEEGFYIG